MAEEPERQTFNEQVRAGFLASRSAMARPLRPQERQEQAERQAQAERERQAAEQEGTP